MLPISVIQLFYSTVDIVFRFISKSLITICIIIMGLHLLFVMIQIILSLYYICNSRLPVLWDYSVENLKAFLLNIKHYHTDIKGIPLVIVEIKDDNVDFAVMCTKISLIKIYKEFPNHKLYFAFVTRNLKSDLLLKYLQMNNYHELDVFIGDYGASYNQIRGLRKDNPFLNIYVHPLVYFNFFFILNFLVKEAINLFIYNILIYVQQVRGFWHKSSGENRRIMKIYSVNMLADFTEKNI